MIKQEAVTVIAICAALFVSTTNSQAQAQKTVTLHGELVDIIAFVSSGAKQDADAVKQSAKAGNPMGLYDPKSKKLYVIGLPQVNKGATESLLPYVGLRVFIKGKAYNRSGLNVILMSDIGKSIK
jgi:hypothetical protein